jgi:DnaK suppressor protein
MTASKGWDDIKKILLEKRNYLIGKMSGKKNTEESAAERDRGDDSDKATASRDLEMNYILSNRERDELKGIENALERIQKKTYGVCEMCGVEIGKKRLMVLPLTPYCLDCQSEMEEESKR